MTMAFSGCVIKRLLEFKRQLNNPQHHIHFQHAGVLVLKKPVLQLEDLELLTGIFPTRIEGNKVRYEFNRPEALEHSLVYVLEFESQKLAVIDYPDIFYNAIESSFAFDSLALFGTAEIPQNGQWNVSNKGKEIAAIPTREVIIDVLGPPTSITNFLTAELYHYHYTHPSINGDQAIQLTLSFHKASKRMQSIDLALPDRNWSIQL